jgi:integrase/recombinase XerD
MDGFNMVLRITGKGNKQRLVPLPRPRLNDPRNLWRTHRNSRWLFPRRDGTGPICVLCWARPSLFNNSA